jgi:hypothetical protein
VGNPAFVLENIETARRIRLFRLLGVPVETTPLAFLNPIALYASSFVLTLIVQPDLALGERLVSASIFAVLGLATLFIHSIGHIIGGKIAGSPMDSLLLTATRQVNVYEGDQEHFTPRVHLLRASGGPAGNFAAALIGLVVVLVGGPSIYALFFTAANLFGAISALAPFPSVDGEVIWRYLGKRQTAKVRN